MDKSYLQMESAIILEREGTRAEYNAKFSLEIERIPDESSREIAAIKNKDSEVCEREKQLEEEKFLALQTQNSTEWKIEQETVKRNIAKRA